MNCCLDTSIVIDLLRGDISMNERISKLANERKIYLTQVTAAELYKGAFLSAKQEDATNLVDNFLSSVEIIALDLQSCKEFGRLYSMLKKRGKLVDEFDLLIASMAKTRGMKIITKDRKHFKGIGIEVESW